MKKTCVFFLVVVFVFVSTSALADESDNLKSQAALCFGTKEYNKGLELYKRAKSLNPKTSMYNAACMATLAGDKDLAFEWLNDVIDNGYNMGLNIMTDEDFASLYSDKRWKKLVRRIKKFGMLPEDVESAVLIVKMGNKEQSIRRKFIEAQNLYGESSFLVDSIGKEMKRVDVNNMKKLDSIFTNKGFLGIKEIGEAGSMSAFLIIQHSNKEMLGKYLPAFREAVANGNAKASQLALMEDRYAQWNGKKQIYGTQADWSKKHGTFVISKGGIENPESVNERRLSVGLNTLEDYAKKMGWLIVE